MQAYRFQTKGVCARQIYFELDEGKVHNLQFTGGCPGNLLAIGKLAEGQDAASLSALLKGNECGGRGTSCADQLAIALEQALAGEDRP